MLKQYIAVFLPVTDKVFLSSPPWSFIPGQVHAEVHELYLPDIVDGYIRL